MKESLKQYADYFEERDMGRLIQALKTDLNNNYEVDFLERDFLILEKDYRKGLINIDDYNVRQNRIFDRAKKIILAEKEDEDLFEESDSYLLNLIKNQWPILLIIALGITLAVLKRVIPVFV